MLNEDEVGPFGLGQLVIRRGVDRYLNRVKPARAPKQILLGWFVDLGDGDVRELSVCRLLLIKDLGQKLMRFGFPKRLCPFPQRAVPRNLVVFDGLATTDDRGVLGNRTFGLLDHALSLLN